MLVLHVTLEMPPQFLVLEDDVLDVDIAEVYAVEIGHSPIS